MSDSKIQHCPTCHHTLRASARFCVMCGVPVHGYRKCGTCGSDTPAYGRFCDQCGAACDDVRAMMPVPANVITPIESVPIDSPTPEPFPQALEPTVEEPIPLQLKKSEPVADEKRGEKRLVTILFADVSGFTAMSENLDSEEVADVMNMVFDRLTHIIVDNGGNIDKYIGDCIMATFGAPTSYGDDAERAVRASLAMQKALTGLADELEVAAGTRLQMRIGLNTGLVRAGYVGGQGHGAYTVMGDNVNLANRLESACKKGQVLISASTCRFVAESYVLSEIEELEVKGKSEVVRAAYVLRERRPTLDDKEDFFEGESIPLMGRVSHLVRLGSMFERVEADEAIATVVVHGACGSGKSRLIEEFCKGLGRDLKRVVYGRQTHRTVTQRMLALQVALNRALTDDWTRGGDGFKVAWKAGLPKQADPDFAAKAQELAREFLAGHDVFGGAGEDESSQRSLRVSLFWGLTRLLVGLCAEKPTILFISSGHLADEMLVDFIDYLNVQVHNPGRLFVIIEEQTQGEDSDLVFNQLIKSGRSHTLNVEPLANSEVVELAHRLLVAAPVVPAWVDEWLVERSEGYPFYAIEHLKALKSLGILKISDRGAWSIDEAPPVSLELPETLHAALQANLDGLDPLERLVLQRASLVGRSFWGQVVESVVSDSADASQVQRAFTSLCAKQLIRKRDKSAVGGASEYRFESDLFMQACYDSVLQKERRQHHGKIARLLTDLRLDQSNPELVGEQYERAGELPKACKLLIAALKAEMQAFNRDTAKKLLGKVSGLIEEGTSDSGRRVAHLLERVEFRALSAEMCRIDGSTERALAHLDAGFKLMHETPERRVPPMREPMDHVEVALWKARGAIHRLQGHLEEAHDDFDAAAVILLRQNPVDEASLIDIRASIASILSSSDRKDEAFHLSREIVETYDKCELKDGNLGQAVARHFDIYGWIKFQRDKNHASALSYFERARQLRLINNNPVLLTVSDNNRAMAFAELGEWDGARRAFERLLSVRKAMGYSQKVATTHLNFAYCLIRMESFEEAREHLDAGVAIAKELGAEPLLKSAERFERLLNEAKADSEPAAG